MTQPTLICPNCGESATFTRRPNPKPQPRGLAKRDYETAITCNLCGLRTTDAEIGLLLEAA